MKYMDLSAVAGQGSLAPREKMPKCPPRHTPSQTETSTYCDEGSVGGKMTATFLWSPANHTWKFTANVTRYQSEKLAKGKLSLMVAIKTIKHSELVARFLNSINCFFFK